MLSTLGEILYSFHKIVSSLFFSLPLSLCSMSAQPRDLNSPVEMASAVKADQFPGYFQHVLTMHHGGQSDEGVGWLWTTRVPMPWDAPLADANQIKALDIGKKLHNELGFPIHEVISIALPTVSMEYGMCEILNDVSLWHYPTGCDSWGFDIKELEASFPPGIADLVPHQVYKEMPQWGESESGARDRYLHTNHSLVDGHPQENLLFVNQGEGVKVMASTYWKEASGREIRPDYFGYAHLKKQLVRNGNSFTADRFRIVVETDETGIERELLHHA
ncbi:hypothetical protein ACJRO7_020332 [Eucalyptus globulus]|uniref:Uncharacterized protein n=1 Tax=Eucalyptus globulus TaxID=34317 RepID=A0ABD3KSX3_EUCGL